MVSENERPDARGADHLQPSPRDQHQDCQNKVVSAEKLFRWKVYLNAAMFPKLQVEDRKSRVTLKLLAQILSWKAVVPFTTLQPIKAGD